MKYFLAVLAIVVEYIVLISFGAAVFGWKYGGGMLPQMLRIAIYAATWRGITRHFPAKKAEKDKQEPVAQTDQE